MRYERTIRFPRPLRSVRLVQPPSASTSDSQAAEAAARALAEVAAAREREEHERRAVDETLAALAEAAESLTRSRNELLGEMQQAAVELATAVAMRVTYDQLQTDRFAIEELVQAVVHRLGATGPVQVRLHPEDLALVNRRRGEGRGAESPDLQLIADESLGRGDCVADAGEVGFASFLEEQLNGLRQHLLRNLSDAQIERRKAAAGNRGLRRFPDRRQTA